MFNESLITRARNYCAANFMKSDADWLFFVDSDIAWGAMDLMYMWHLISTRDDLKVFCGLYPKKTIAWEKVLHAAKSGMYDNDPTLLEKVAGDMVFNPLPDEYPDGQAPIFEPVKIKEGATGFMFIHRSVFEKYNEEHPERLYTPDHLREGEFKHGERIMAYFDCIINDQNRYLSEDYMFSEYCRDMGIDIWALPMVELMHCGSHIFQGKLIDMAMAGVHATLAPEEVKKKIERDMNDIEQSNAPNPGTLGSDEAQKNSS
tara:strand:+ start:46 stop:825 length:780 start_codon:yes stop_codon:yes gene_type:complete